MVMATVPQNVTRRHLSDAPTQPSKILLTRLYGESIPWREEEIKISAGFLPSPVFHWPKLDPLRVNCSELPGCVIGLFRELL